MEACLPKAETTKFVDRDGARQTAEMFARSESRLTSPRLVKWSESRLTSP